jgi:hypothetical protein
MSPIANDQHPSDDAFKPNPLALRLDEAKHFRRSVVTWALFVCVLGLGVGVLVLYVAKVRESERRSDSQGNLMQIGKAVTSAAATSPSQAYIPPAFGVFPNGGTVDATFFFHLLPFIEGGYGYSQHSGNPAGVTTPFWQYRAGADSFNPGTSNLCSYAANANFLRVSAEGRPPRLTDGGRIATTLIVAERSAKTGAVWNTYTPASVPGAVPSGPFFYVYYPPTANPAQTYVPTNSHSANWPSTALGTSPPTALRSDGCMVGMLDGSARIVNSSNIANNAWLMACDPVNNPGPMPANW